MNDVFYTWSDAQDDLQIIPSRGEVSDVEIRKVGEEFW